MFNNYTAVSKIFSPGDLPIGFPCPSLNVVIDYKLTGAEGSSELLS